MTSADKPLSQLSRSELYERLRSQSKDEITLHEMQRLGFWPKGEGQPTETAEVSALIERESALTQTLGQLRKRLAQVGDPEQALKAMRRERMAQAKARREATRQAHAQKRFARADAWYARRQVEVLYLGAEVSGGLSAKAKSAESTETPRSRENDPARLARWDLPAPDDAMELARAMGVTVAELRFLAYDRAVSTVSHYRRFQLAKKSGGLRTISAPMPRLKRLQYWVLDNILAKVPVHDAAHGFRPGRNIASNAAPHVGRAVVVNLDLKDFFPSIAYPRVKGVFRSLGYGEALASLLGLLCTERPAQAVEVDGAQYFVAEGARHLPQGAPTSPALTNILCLRLDKRLAGMAAKLGFAYTRYADDLSFSADAPAHKQVGKLLWRARQIIESEGFTLHPDKQHVMRAHQRQSVTGLVVNQKPSIDRATFKRFRATVHQVEKDGPAGKQWNGNADVVGALLGYAHFLHMVDPGRAAPWLARVQALHHKHDRHHNRRTAPAENKRSTQNTFRGASRAGQAPWFDWWQPAQPPEPVLEKTDAQRREEKQARLQQERQQARQQARLARTGADLYDDEERDDFDTPETPEEAELRAYIAQRNQQADQLDRAIGWLDRLNQPLVLQLFILAVWMFAFPPMPLLAVAVVALLAHIFVPRLSWGAFLIAMAVALFVGG